MWCFECVFRVFPLPQLFAGSFSLFSIFYLPLSLTMHSLKICVLLLLFRFYFFFFFYSFFLLSLSLWCVSIRYVLFVSRSHTPTHTRFVRFMLYVVVQWHPFRSFNVYGKGVKKKKKDEKIHYIQDERKIERIANPLCKVVLVLKIDLMCKYPHTYISISYIYWLNGMEWRITQKNDE